MSLVGFCPIKILDKHGETLRFSFFLFLVCVLLFVLEFCRQPNGGHI